MTIKHHGHEKDDITLQSSNVHHMKHFEAGAHQSIVRIAYQQTVTRRNQPSLEQLIKESVTISYDVILVEGFKMRIMTK